ncbi:MAG TPA: CBS domain-containing protein [Polyangiaceae bacterium]
MEPLQTMLEHKGRDIHAVEVTATVLQAADKMSRTHVGALLVMDDDRLAGIFSERDLMTRVVMARKDPAKTRVEEVMTPGVVSVRLETTPREAMSIMTRRRVRHLPVVSGTRIVGVISIGDLVRATLDERDHEISELHDYVTGRYPG